jgi:putative transposase
VSPAKKRDLITTYRKKRHDTPITWLTKAIGLSKQGWYHVQKPPPDTRVWKAKIEAVLEAHSYYGYLRVTKELQRQGEIVNHKRIYKIMGEYHLLQLRKKRTPPQTTNSNHRFYVYTNEIKHLSQLTTGTVWVSDITYIPSAVGWLYLALIMDQHSRRIVGWALGTTMHRSLCISALRMALSQHAAPRYHHSDRGVQYCSHDYIEILKSHNVAPSMADVGVSVDNPHAESLNRSIKVEEVYRNEYLTFADALLGISTYITVYNTTRLHSSLGYLSPVQFEAQSLLPRQVSTE